MSNNTVGLAVAVAAIVMIGLLLIVIVWKLLDIARERTRARLSADDAALAQTRRVIGADLAEIRHRLDNLETRQDNDPPDEPSDRQRKHQ